MCKKSCELYDTDFDRGGFVGVAIAGYGEEEIYPHLVHLHIGGVIDTKLKYNIIENVEISQSSHLLSLIVAKKRFICKPIDLYS